MFEFKLPDLGEGVAEGQIVSVLVKEGEDIAEFQPMLEVETDKAAVEIPAPKAGRVDKVHVQAGQTVKVGQVLVSIDDGGAAPAKDKAKAEPAKAGNDKEKDKDKAQAEPEPAKSKSAEPAEPKPEPARAAATTAPTSSQRTGPVPAAPAVRKLARELGVDLAAVKPTGPRGRVVREDVERAALSREGGAPAGAGGPLPAAAVAAELPDFSQYGPIRREPAPQIRKTIARQMALSWASVARVTHADVADVTDLDRARKDYNGHLREGETKLTLTAVVVKAVALALRAHPRLNATYDAVNGEMIFKDYVHIGIAVDTPRGLVVPVLRDADGKPLPALAAEMNDLVSRTRNAKFEISELRGASFTITNIGPLGGRFFTPMVNFPESAILGLGRADLQPAVHEGQIVPRLILPLSLSFDHRGVDGAEAARFCTDLIGALQNPLRLLALQ
jgi:pyruvate dehydrogenase E2 component (dihydrolipoamide acetyltransferase)